MAMDTLQELLKHELGDLLFAEKTILKGLKKMTREVADPELKERMEAHYAETEQQIVNLERVFQSVGLKAKAEKCPGILGIMTEHDEFKSDEEPSKPILEAFVIGSGLRVEHYEIAAYNTAIALARQLGHREAIGLLRTNLEQEVAMAKFLTTSAARGLQAVQVRVAAEEEKTARRDARTGNGAAKSAGGRKAGARKTVGTSAQRAD